MNPEKLENNFPNNKIASEIKQMFKEDQEMRERRHQADRTNAEEDAKIDENNTSRMREIIEEIGWPTISKVGESASYDAWLLVQHADHDIDFQEHCLNLMKLVPEDEIDLMNIAYLEDRVRVNQGRGQLYGTQFSQEDGQHVPREIEKPDTIDERRAAVGMGTLQDQINSMQKKYTPSELEDSDSN